MISEEATPARALPQSRYGTGALVSLVHRDFKELLLQWRKRSGRWAVPMRIRADQTFSVNVEILWIN